MAGLPPDYRPKLRRSVTSSPTGEPGRVALHDARRLVPGVVVVREAAMALIRAFSGQYSLAELATAIGQGEPALQVVTQLVQGLDEALLLESERFQMYIAGPHRFPSCLGCYPEEPEAIRAQLSDLFNAPGGPGLPTIRNDEGKLRAIFLPHIDYTRGGVTYGWGFKELVEQSNAKLFFIIGTSHYSPERFTLSRKNYQTPLGIVPTDQAMVDLIEEAYGPGLFNDPYAHLPEHSIELEVLMLQYLLDGKRPFRIVPLLVGSFFDCVENGTVPSESSDIDRMVKALMRAEAAAKEEVCYLISGDLAHIGPKFQDPRPLTDEWLAESLTEDEALLDCLSRTDAHGFFDRIAAEQNGRNICGLPPAWVALLAAQASSGKVLHYGRYVCPERYESVSFAAAAFYQ